MVRWREPACAWTGWGGDGKGGSGGALLLLHVTGLAALPRPAHAHAHLPPDAFSTRQHPALSELVAAHSHATL